MPHNIYDTNSALNANNLKTLYQQYNGPIWVYEAETIISRIKKLNKFDVLRFAQKACSNIHILRLIRNQRAKVDAVSLGEIERALLAGFTPGTHHEEIIFTADLLEIPTLQRIIELNIPVNIGSISMLEQLGRYTSGHNIWLRINPGFGDGQNKKINTGGEHSKHGIWYNDLPLAISYINRYHLRLIGLHMHIGSGLNNNNLSQVCNKMMQCIILCKKDISAISAGGGLSIPYHNKGSSFNINKYFKLWDNTRKRISAYLGHPVKLEVEPGRFIVAESGVLVSQVRTVKKVNNRYFVLVDVGFNDLVRPAMYGSYHHISLIPADNRKFYKHPLIDTLVGGPLCESGDLFTQDIQGNVIPYKLPPIKVGDYLVFHDTGAYGASMSSNYNSRPLLPEILFEHGIAKQIRRRQQLEELFHLEQI